MGFHDVHFRTHSSYSLNFVPNEITMMGKLRETSLRMIQRGPLIRRKLFDVWEGRKQEGKSPNLRL